MHDAIAQDVMIIFDELASNIVRYAWRDGPGHAFEAELRLLPAEGTLRLTLTDDGVPFDPAAAPPPPQVDTIDDLAPGGHGLALVRTLSDGMTYAHTDGRNQIEVCKRLL